MVNRRKAIIALAALGAIGPTGAFAQAGRPRARVACLSIGTEGGQGGLRKRVESGLAAAGFQAVELRFFNAASDDFDAMARNAAEAVAWTPDAILAPGPLHASAAYGATRTTPIVFFGVPDPEVFGLIQSHARPGGNATGSALNSASGTVKRLELVRELVPGARRVAVLYRRRPRADVRLIEKVRRELADGAEQLKLVLEDAEVGAGGRGFKATLDAIARRPPDAVLPFGPYGWEPGGESPDTTRLFIEFERKLRVPVIHEGEHAVVTGGVIAMYDVGSQLGAAIEILARVLAGASPAQIPVAFPLRNHLAINPGAARAIGLALPPSVVIRADRVVD